MSNAQYFSKKSIVVVICLFMQDVVVLNLTRNTRDGSDCGSSSVDLMK
jgi:hypothetical protein